MHEGGHRHLPALAQLTELVERANYAHQAPSHQDVELATSALVKLQAELRQPGRQDTAL